MAAAELGEALVERNRKHVVVVVADRTAFDRSAGVLLRGEVKPLSGMWVLIDHRGYFYDGKDAPNVGRRISHSQLAGDGGEAVTCIG